MLHTQVYVHTIHSHIYKHSSLYTLWLASGTKSLLCVYCSSANFVWTCFSDNIQGKDICFYIFYLYNCTPKKKEERKDKKKKRGQMSSENEEIE